ncbi:unnamed protein product [Rhodiola kirilowii]
MEKILTRHNNAVPPREKLCAESCWSRGCSGVTVWGTVSMKTRCSKNRRW